MSSSILRRGDTWISHTAYQQRCPSPADSVYSRPCDGDMKVQGFERNGLIRTECTGCGFEVYVRQRDAGSFEQDAMAV